MIFIFHQRKLDYKLSKLQYVWPDEELEGVCKGSNVFQGWSDQLHTPHEVRFIPDDLLFVHPDLQEIQPTIQVDSDGYVVLEAYLSLDIISLELEDFKTFAGDMKRLYNLDVVFQPLNIGNSGTAQGRYLKARIPKLILVDYSGRGYSPFKMYFIYCAMRKW